MRRISILAPVILFLILAGCAGTGFLRQQNPARPVPEMAGLVPVVFINTSQVARHVWLFEGVESVDIVPDYGTGGWVFSRPPFFEFEIPPARSNDWATEIRVWLPRNFLFAFCDQAVRFWGRPIGRPNISYRRTGSTPISASYRLRTPTGGTALAGAVVELPYVDAAGPAGLHIKIKLDPRATIEDGLEALYRVLY